MNTDAEQEIQSCLQTSLAGEVTTTNATVHEAPIQVVVAAQRRARTFSNCSIVSRRRLSTSNIRQLPLEEMPQQDDDKTFRLALLAVMFLFTANAGALLSLQAPFYPLEAEKKNATPSEYGFAFGITNLAAFLASPLCARFGDAIGATKLYTGGFLLTSFSGIAFGFLAYAQDKGIFLFFSYILRALLGLADIISWSAGTSVIMSLFPDNPTMVMAAGETSLSVGYSLGPALGAGLYTLGGFSLPFYVIGSTAFLFSTMAICMLRKAERKIIVNAAVSRKDDTFGSPAQQKIKFRDVFTTFNIVAPFIDNFMSSCACGMMEAMLGHHLSDDDDIGATAGQVGITFLIIMAAYTVASIFGGWACDKVSNPTLISIAGNNLLTVAFLLIGPVPFLSHLVKASLYFEYGVVVLFGLGYSLVMVSTFSRAIRAVAILGFNKDDTSTQMMVTGMWSATFYLGTFVGPTMAGFLVDNHGFRFTSVLFCFFFMGSLVMNIIEIAFNRLKRRRNGYQRI